LIVLIGAILFPSRFAFDNLKRRPAFNDGGNADALSALCVYNPLRQPAREKLFC
jgi:hypothetical protein